MANVQNGVEKLPAENFSRVSRVHERYRETERRQTYGRVMTYSEHEHRRSQGCTGCTCNPQAVEKNLGQIYRGKL